MAGDERFLTKLPEHKLEAKIIAFDLDDTLLTASLTILPRTVAALRAAAEKNIFVVLCSGRAENAMLPYIRTLSIAGRQQGRYLIAMNGASIYDLHLRQQIYSRSVEAEVLKFVHEEATGRGFPVQVYDSSTIYASAKNKWVERDVHLSKLNLQIIEGKDQYDKFLEKGFPKMVVPAEPEDLVVFEKFLKEKLGDRAVVFTSKPYFLEVLPPNCGKGEAFLWLAEHLGCSPKNTMAFGDSFNDLTMIQLAAHGVAMRNGAEKIKEIADYVTRLDNEHDGIADFLEEFVL